MKAFEAGILTKSDKNGVPLVRFRILFFTENSTFYVICLETGIIGYGKDKQSALQDLMVLVEDDLFIRSQGNYDLEVEPASDVYRMAFARIHKERKLPIPKVPKVNLNDLVKKISKQINPKKPTNYFLNEQIA